MAIGIGETLRTARRALGVSVAEAASATRVRAPYLEALEREDFAAIGGDLYVRGFLRSYATYLALDPAPLVAAYRETLPEPEPRLVSMQPATLAAAPRGRSLSPVVGVVAVVLVLLVGLSVVGLVNPGDDGDVAVQRIGPPPVPSASAAPSTAPAPEPSPSTAPSPRGLAGADTVNLTVNVRGGDSWMRVTVNDEVVLEGLKSDGFEETFSGDEVVVRLGDPGPADLVVNGATLDELRAGVPVNVICTAGSDECRVE